MCGEDIATIVHGVNVAGRSPRVRGRRLNLHQLVRDQGTIPACAGKTANFARTARKRKDDPRVCGEDWLVVNQAPSGRGRSPRVRGRRHLFEVLAPARGTIPACAGKTWITCHADRERGDDPRVCGEDVDPLTKSEREEGRSPRVRGRLRIIYSSVKRVRTIPACAGKTQRP